MWRRAALADFDLQRGNSAEALSYFNTCIAELFGANTSEARYTEMVRSTAIVRTLQSASTLRYYRPLEYIPQVVRERGRTLLQMHRPADALPDLRVALQLNPADAVARTALEECYHETDQEAPAEAVHRMDDVLLGRPL